MVFGKSRKFKFLSLLTLVVVLIFGLSAGNTALAVTASSISANVTPPNPAPYENTTITLSSYVSNLDIVLITWMVDGKNAASGIGKKSFSVTAGAAGVATNVVARVALPDGGIDVRIVIKPNVMVLLWQAEDSYVPPFYRGKAMPTADTEIKVVAMPEIKSTSATNMAYSWRLNYNNDQSASGYGKNFFTYTNDYLDSSDTIGVTASTIDGSSSTDANVTIGTTTPQISFYKNDPALGTLWENSLSDGYKIVGGEVLVAIPYFISPSDIRIPVLNWTWSINNNTVTPQVGRKNFLPLKAPAGATGTAQIGLQIDSRDKIFETASKQLNVQF